MVIKCRHWASALLIGLAADPVRAQSVPDQTKPPEFSPAMAGMLLGAAAGIGAGFLLADATDYALEEGGAYGVIFLGSVIGGFVGGRVGASLNNDWAERPGRVQLTMQMVRVIGSTTHRRAVLSLRRGGFSATNQTHSFVPSARLAVRLTERLEAGFELSGTEAQWLRAQDGVAYVGQQISGSTRGVFGRYTWWRHRASRASLTLTGGLDKYAIEVLRWFDPRHPPDFSGQDDHLRAANAEHDAVGVQLGGGISLYFVRDVALQFLVTSRYGGSVVVPGIRLVGMDGSNVRAIAPYKAHFSMVNAGLAIGMHF